MGHSELHFYVEPDGTSTSTVPSNATLDATSLGFNAAAVGVAALGAVDGVAFMAPILLMTGEPAGYGLAFLQRTTGLLPIGLVIPLFIALSLIGLSLGTWNLIWGYRRKLHFQKVCRRLTRDPAFRAAFDAHWREEHGKDFFVHSPSPGSAASPTPAPEHGH